MSALPDLKTPPRRLAGPVPAHGAFAGSPVFLSLLELDPDLGAGLPAEHLPAAAMASRAELVHLAKGPLDWGTLEQPRLGYLLLSGLVARMVRVGRRESLELLGEGDLIQPWREDDLSLVECEVRWEVLGRARAAKLDDRLARVTARWPQIESSLIARGLRRARWQSVQAAINAHPRVRDRLLLMFCHIGERTGRMGRDGILFDLPLSHRLVSEVVQAMRPSVTNALLRLREDGLLEQRGRWEWLITHEGISVASDLCRQS
jgi:CRP/FNR family transcriptional regulator, cyclic AMP receptor protein